MITFLGLVSGDERIARCSGDEIWWHLFYLASRQATELRGVQLQEMGSAVMAFSFLCLPLCPTGLFSLDLR